MKSYKRALFGHHFSHVAIIALVIILVLCVIAIALIHRGTVGYQALGFKVLEILAQTVAVTIAGGLLVQAYLKWHSRELAINEFRRALLDGVIKDYIEVKRIRRLLRSEAEHNQGGTEVNPWTHISAVAYDKYLTELNTAELSLEVLCRRVEAFASVFPNAQSLAEGIRAMHEYLDEVVSEFERHKSVQQTNSGLLQVCELTALSGFMFRKDQSSFTRFSIPYHRVLQNLQGDAVRVFI